MNEIAVITCRRERQLDYVIFIYLIYLILIKLLSLVYNVMFINHDLAVFYKIRWSILWTYIIQYEWNCCYYMYKYMCVRMYIHTCTNKQKHCRSPPPPPPSQTSTISLQGSRERQLDYVTFIYLIYFIYLIFFTCILF